jgi:hypothetical protein
MLHHGEAHPGLARYWNIAGVALGVLTSHGDHGRTVVVECDLVETEVVVMKAASESGQPGVAVEHEPDGSDPYEVVIEQSAEQGCVAAAFGVGPSPEELFYFGIH